MPTITPRAERRRAPRVRVDLPLDLAARDARAEACLKDLSTHGLCCSFPESIPELTLVRVGLELEGEPMELEGAVVRCEKVSPPPGFEVAVFFTRLQEEDRTRIHAFVKGRLEGRPGPS